MGPAKVGVVGTGFIGRGFVRQSARQQDFETSAILTRRHLDDFAGMLFDRLHTNCIDEFVDAVDLVVECSGDVLHATQVIDAAMNAGRPVITLNSEFQVTTGSWFADRGILVEAEGDQPGCLAAFHREAVEMGFDPIVYGNTKGFLNRNPSKSDMEYWSAKQGISSTQVTSFTDGTKIQIEQALVANGLNAGIVKTGLLGVQCEKLVHGVEQLTAAMTSRNQRISDYILCPENPGGVFIVARHDQSEAAALEYFKLGQGPNYLLTRNFHLCHLEICKTIRQVLTGVQPSFNNSTSPTIGVAALAKSKIAAGSTIPRGIGGHHFYGEATPIEEMTNQVPIGLLNRTTMARSLEPHEPVTWDAVHIEPSLALNAWLTIINRANRPPILKFPNGQPPATEPQPRPFQKSA